MKLILSFVWLTLMLTVSVKSQNAPVYVTLWFDTEDYILPQSDDAAKRLAEMLTRLGVKATFKVVGEKARVLEQRGRRDVIAALKKHEIGYHSNYHSIHPTPAEYLQNEDWDDGIAEFYRRESPGVKDIQRIFGVTPSCYGQPGSSWGPQSYPALKQMGINIYLDEADHVGVDDQPFYYGGMLNIFKMRSNVCRMELFEENNLAKGKAEFLAAYEKLKAKGGGTISIYYHPCEWVHQQFWDGVNFSRGANPLRKDWKLPPTRSGEETEKAFRDFEEYVKFIKSQRSVRFVTANELKVIYEDKAVKKSFGKIEVEKIAKAVQTEVSFLKMKGYTLSPADIFSILNEALRNALYDDIFPLPRMEVFSGPAQRGINIVPSSTLQPVPFTTFKESIAAVSSQLAKTKRIPDEIRIGTTFISPEDYLATLGEVMLMLMKPGQLSSQIVIRKGNFTADKYVANDDPKLFNWVIHPEGFHAPKIMELARLQAWTLKPAVMRR